MSRPIRRARAAGFTLLPVVLAMSLTAAIAFLLNRDNGVNASLIGAQSDRERARYAAEAGLQAANYVIQANACAGGYPISSSPVTDSDFGGAAYSAYANNTSGSPLTLTATGTYNGASVTLTRSSVYAYQSPKKVWGAQPGPASGKDTFVGSNNPSDNSGGSTRLALRFLREETLLQFDLSPLPAGSRIIPWYDSTAGRLQPGAQVSLYKTNADGAVTDSINVQLITRSWVAGTLLGSAPADGATWNTYDGVNAWPAPGAGYDPRALPSAPYRPSPGWQDLDVTDAVLGWISGVHTNYGIWLRDAGTLINNARYVASNDTANVTQRPKLTTNYLLPCGATAPAWGITATLNPVADARVNSGSTSQNYGNAATMILVKAANDNRGLLRFDISSIPAGTIIQSATLRLDVTATTNATANPKVIRAYALTPSWVEGTALTPANGATWLTRDGSVNWTIAGGSYRLPAVATATQESTGVSPPPASFATGWLTWNLTPLVQEWVDGVTANNGVIIISTVADRMNIPSRENGNAANRPQLVIAY